MQLYPGPPALPELTLTKEVGFEAIRPFVHSGQLEQVRRGAYAEPSQGEDPWVLKEARALAHAVAVTESLRCTFVLSHQTAALVHGCWLEDLDGLTHITVPIKPEDNEVGGLRRHLAPWCAEDVTDIGGLRVTSLERTIADCARTMAPRAGLCVADSGLRILDRPDRFDRDASQRRLSERLHRLSRRMAGLRRYPGVVRGRAVIGAADGFSESPGETRLRWVALSRGLPRPTCQLEVSTELGTFFVDLGWRLPGGEPGVGDRVIAEEYDGREKYVARPGDRPDRVLFEEKRREDALRRAGAEPRRRISEDLSNPDRLAADLISRFPLAVQQTFRPVAGLLSVRPSRVSAQVEGSRPGRAPGASTST